MRIEDFERLYEDHAQGLFSFVSYRTGDRTLAEDVVADTFERALKARRRFDPRKATAKTWLYSIALNRLRDIARREQTKARTLERIGPPESGDDLAFGRIEDRDAVARALAGLSAEEREVVALRYGGDLTVREVAELIGEPLTTVEGRVYRALRKLREEL
jgi:RNA polymerase sigma-70 factor (ECF subfamily)